LDDLKTILELQEAQKTTQDQRRKWILMRSSLVGGKSKSKVAARDRLQDNPSLFFFTNMPLELHNVKKLEGNICGRINEMKRGWTQRSANSLRQSNKCRKINKEFKCKVKNVHV